MKTYQEFGINYFQDEDGVFTAVVPAIRGCVTSGKTLEQAWDVSNAAVAEALEGLPPIKMHCSVLAEEGIHKAINDYRQKHGLELWVEKNPHSHEHDEMTCQH